MSDPPPPPDEGRPILPRVSEALATDSGEFDDISHAFLPQEVQLSRLRHPAVVRLLLGFGIALAIVAWPRRSNDVFVVLLALFLALFSAQMLYQALRLRPRDWPTVGSSALGAVVAIILMLEPARAIESVGRVIALLVILFALSDFIRSLRRRRASGGGPFVWPIAKCTALVAFGAVLAAYPAELLVIATSAFAAVWGILALLTLTQVLTAPEDEPSISITTSCGSGWQVARARGSTGGSSTARSSSKGPTSRGASFRTSP